MSRKIIKFPSILRKSKLLEPKQPWQWPSCKHPKTLSFRAVNDDVFRTLNSVFLDDGAHSTPDSWFTTSSASECTSCNYSDETNINNAAADPESSVETIIRGAVKSSDRLFFEPDRTSSILKQDAAEITPAAASNSSSDHLPFKESVALALESEDPYSDFKKSMQEMVESHGLKDWECLEELLGWYLRMNRQMNHGIIVGAFVDLLVGLADDDSDNNNHRHQVTNSCSDSASYSSADSCFSSHPCSPVAAAAAVDGDQLLGGIDDDHVGAAAGDAVVVH